MRSSLLALASLVLLATTTAASADPAATTKVHGTLQTGIVAIGGETTGIILGSYELDLHGDAALERAASRLDGKPALVVGTLTTQRGVEIAERYIIRVTSLAPAAP